MKTFLKLASIAAMASQITSPALADDEKRDFTYSFNIGGYSDYRFRGVSQTGGDPAIQGGADFGYGIAYFGLWASNLDFGTTKGGRDIANAEVDIYGGIKPVWHDITFDLGVIYYDYPRAKDAGAELDYVEFKLGASFSPADKLTTGLTFYWSPDNTGDTGDTYTLEGTASYALPKVGIFDPSLSGRLGWQHGSDNGKNSYSALLNGDDSYLYWDAGLTLTVEKLAFDFRYIDTDVSNAGGFCKGPLFQCDATFLFSVKATLP